MRFNSINVKLFAIIVGAFFCSTVSSLLIADKKLTDIIDNSKNALYSEKVDAIWSILHQHNERLEKTGLVEAYLEDFKDTTLNELQRTYYKQPGLSIYPFIIDTDGNIVMHPTLPENTPLPDGHQITNKMLFSDRGDFDFTFMGQPKYYIFRSFPQWQWVIAYAVPLEIKYAEARKFKNLLFIIMTGVSLSILLLLIPVIARFTKPITRLTSAAKAMAGGNLDTEMPVGGSDEIGILANSFRDMRGAIEHTINELKRENAERRNAEEALANEKEQLAVTLISIGDGVITSDTQGRILLMNKVGEELTGWDSVEATGLDLKEVFRVVDSQTREPVGSIVDRIITSDTMMCEEGQKTLISRSGTERILACTGAPIKDASKNIIGVILVFRDITNQLEIEQELQKSRKLESIGVLAGGIAHDFNNILAIILGNVDLALQENSLLEQTRKQLNTVAKASLRAQSLTKQLLTFSKGGAPVKAISSLESLIRDSADFVLHGSNVACRFDIPTDLWAADIDKGQISQVIQNVVLNGCEAMPGGGVIAISCANVVGGENTNSFLLNGQKYVAISIADSGEGIPASDIDKIFDPYFTTKMDGNGLGLAICHSIVIKHHGYIGVKSSRKTGTVITIYLPATDGIRITDDIQITEEKVAENVPDTMKARVLIMDDEELVREMVELILAEMGHTPVPAVDGTEAVELYKKNKESGTPINLVIMDLTIPGAMGGREAIKKLLSYDRKAKAIVCSGYSNDPVIADPGKYGFRAAIVKPFRFREFAEVIDRTLSEPAS